MEIPFYFYVALSTSDVPVPLLTTTSPPSLFFAHPSQFTGDAPAQSKNFGPGVHLGTL
jgi:hypothetical protein